MPLGEKAIGNGPDITLECGCGRTSAGDFVSKVRRDYPSASTAYTPHNPDVGEGRGHGRHSDSRMLPSSLSPPQQLPRRVHHGKTRRLAFWRKLVGLEENGTNLHERVATTQPSAERVLLAREELEAVWTAAASLSQQQRAVFLLRFAEEMPLAEIADVLGLKVGSVKAQLFRALGKVRGALKEQKSR